jgi:hypothetical protein
MRAIEFESIIEGDTIRIPTRYVAEVGSIARVILLTDDSLSAAEKRFGNEDFSELHIPTKGWVFSREEANERN